MASQLYAALGGSKTTSDLYSVDTATGDMTSIGPIGFAVTGLAIDPTSGILYGATNSNSASHPHALITIDMTTGAGTLVADLSMGRAAADICFDASGQLYGWDSNAGGLWAIDKGTGSVTAIGSVVSDYSGGLDFQGVTLYHVIGNDHDVETVSTSTGALTVIIAASDTTRLQAGKFNPDTGVFWGTQTGNNNLVTVNVSSGVVTVQASLTIGGVAQNNVDAIVWGPPPGPFSLSCSPAPLNFTVGVADTLTSTLTSTLTGGVGGTASLSTSGAPSGVTVNLSAGTINENGGTVTITVSCTASVSAGTYPITITAVGEATVTGTLVVSISGTILLDPRDDYNTSSTTLHVTSTGIWDSSARFNGISGDQPEELPESDWPTAFYVRGDRLPPTGRYRIFLKIHVVNEDGSSSTNGSNAFFEMWAGVRINGLTWVMPSDIEYDLQSGQAVPSAERWVELTGPPVWDVTGFSFDYNNCWGGGPEYYGIKSGDVIEFTLHVDKSSSLPIEVTQIKFEQIASGGGPGTAIDLLEFDDKPLGQPNYPSEASMTNYRVGGVGTDPYNGLAVLDSGDVYVFSLEYPFTGSAAFLALYRWNGTTWSVVNGDVAGVGGSGSTNLRYQSARLVTDGTDLWMCWGQDDPVAPTFTKPSPTSLGVSGANTVWRVKKYTPATNTFTELGSSNGQAFILGSARTTNYCSAGDATSMPSLAVGPDGKVWVGWTETVDVIVGENSSGPEFRSYCAWWNGSAWTMKQLPYPPTVREGTGHITKTPFGPIVDFFTGTTGTPLTTPWVNPGNIFQIRTNAVGLASAQTNVKGIVYNDGSPLTDMDATITGSGSTNTVAVGARLQVPFTGSADLPDGYWVTNLVGGSSLKIIKVVGGVQTILASSVSSPGSGVGIRVYGTTIEAWSSSTLLLSATDSTFASGYAGIGLASSTALSPFLDNFSRRAYSATGHVLINSGWINVDDQELVTMCFRHHDGPSNWPSFAYAVHWFFADTGMVSINSGMLPDGSLHRNNEIIYSEYDGDTDTFSNVLQFTQDDLSDLQYGVDTDVAGRKQYGSLFSPSNSFGIFPQGMQLVATSSKVVLLAGGGASGGTDRIYSWSLKDDGSGFEGYPGPYKQPDYIWRADPHFLDDSLNSDVAFGAWEDPTSIVAAVDDQGKIWAGFNNAYAADNTGMVMITDQDPGSNLGWTVAAKVKGELPGDTDGLGFGKIAVRGNDLYAMMSADVVDGGNNSCGPLVWHATIHRGAYIPYSAAVLSSGAHFNIRI